MAKPQLRNHPGGGVLKTDSQDRVMPEEPPIAPDPVVIPGQDPPGPLPGSDAPDPPAPPETGPDVPPLEFPDTP